MTFDTYLIITLVVGMIFKKKKKRIQYTLLI